MNLPSAISRTSPGISTSTGQPAMQSGFLHWMQRLASAIAVSSMQPVGASLKFVTQLGERECQYFSFTAVRSQLDINHEHHYNTHIEQVIFELLRLS
jgi:hypothetical protein